MMKVVLLTLFLLFVSCTFGTDISDAAIEQEFKKEDKNGDGKLSLAEVLDATAKDGGAPVPPEIAKMIEESFKTDDKDGDGKLSLAEVQAKVQNNIKLAEDAPED